eukprot:108957-Amphidinium_carterae.2
MPREWAAEETVIYAAENGTWATFLPPMSGRQHGSFSNLPCQPVSESGLLLRARQVIPRRISPYSWTHKLASSCVSVSFLQLLSVDIVGSSGYAEGENFTKWNHSAKHLSQGPKNAADKLNNVYKEEAKVDKQKQKNKRGYIMESIDHSELLLDKIFEICRRHHGEAASAGDDSPMRSKLRNAKRLQLTKVPFLSGTNIIQNSSLCLPTSAVQYSIA